jgi:hypothetical protein
MQASDYAKALYETGSNPKHLKSLRAILARRGHEKLLPRILSEYQKLQLGAARLAKHKKVTPQSERTRVLLELYRKLTTHHA